MHDKIRDMKSLNPVIGCSIGCPYCYAKRINERFSHTPDFTKPQFFPERLEKLYRKKPTMWFLTSMSDISDWDPFWIKTVLSVIKKNPQHQYLFLTKRPNKLDMDLRGLNVWPGVTVTCKADLHRISELQQHVKSDRYSVTFEPLFEDLGQIDLRGISWVVIGTETGNRKDKVIAKKEWIMNIAEQAKELHIPIMMKAVLEPIVGSDAFIQTTINEII